tara:strand:+ start:38 stop:439 length:402 start_codon:yes stop_codon:yes gene_type:complete
MEENKILITKDLIDKFVEFSGDNNPIHLSESFAKRTPFKKRIAHGTIILSKISKLLTKQFGEGNILLEEHVKFLRPIYLDDLIELNVENIKKGEKSTNIMTIFAVNQKDEKVLECISTCKRIYLKEKKNEQFR